MIYCDLLCKPLHGDLTDLERAFTAGFQGQSCPAKAKVHCDVRRTRIELVPNAWKAFMLTTTPAPLGHVMMAYFWSLYIYNGS